ncbi:MAG: hypothetical protein NC548_46440 [Lachnospiraceae bacterium]|nr:hypothetical protein [Lachnospiraceae bacterium]
MKRWLGAATLAVALALPCTSAAQTNLLEGAFEVSKGNPYEVGWRFDGCSASDFNVNDPANAYDAAGIYFRTNQGLSGNGAYDGATCLYMKYVGVKLGQAIKPEAGKVYELQGHL